MHTNNLFHKRLTPLLMTAAFLVATAWAGETKLKVGKKGDVHFGEATMVGDVVLKPGNYQLQHQVKDGDHYVDFIELKHSPNSQEHYSNIGIIGAAHPGGAKCQLESLATKVDRTAIHIDTSKGQRRITRIEIRGENVAHVF